MAFTSGRGRPPTSNPIVGDVEWDDECKCWASSNYYYWHGTKFGGWKKEPPDVDLSREEKRRKVDDLEKNKAKMPRARPPTGNEIVGLDVTYNLDLKCFATERDYYWHGTFNGGWKKYAPGMEPQLKKDDLVREINGSGNTKGRRPRPPNEGDSVDYDKDRGRWVSSSGLIWLGTYNGGWVKDPTAGSGKVKVEAKEAVVVEAKEQGRKSQGGNKKGRRPAAPTGGGLVEFSTEYDCWFCTGLGTDQYWHGAKSGWKSHPPARVVEVIGEVIEDNDDDEKMKQEMIEDNDDDDETVSEGTDENN